MVAFSLLARTLTYYKGWLAWLGMPAAQLPNVGLFLRLLPSPHDAKEAGRASAWPCQDNLTTT